MTPLSVILIGAAIMLDMYLRRAKAKPDNRKLRDGGRRHDD